MHEKKKHLHTLLLKGGQTVRGTKFKDKIFKCLDPDCYFYMKAADLIGKRAKCPICLKDYILERNHLELLKKPHCDGCTKGSKAAKKVLELQKMETNVTDYLEKLGIKI